MSEEQTFWMPDTLPSPTEEYQSRQKAKSYLTPESKERKHPGWTYQNQALVDDEYLYRNEGWMLVVDNFPEEKNDDTHEIDRRPVSEWVVSGNGKNVTVKYEVWDIIEGNYPNEDILDFDKTFYVDEEDRWVRNEALKTITKTFSIVSLPAEEVAEKEEIIWESLREHRNRRLAETDIIILKGLENGKSISDAVKAYRQALRDFPSTITNIREIDRPNTRLEDDTIWPVKPAESNYYA